MKVMRTDLVYAKNYRAVQRLCPWATVIAANGIRREWMIFESRKDYRIWRKNRKKIKLLGKGELKYEI